MVINFVTVELLEGIHPESTLGESWLSATRKPTVVELLMSLLPWERICLGDQGSHRTRVCECNAGWHGETCDFSDAEAGDNPRSEL
eukprot:m.391661 g.391661  ORF g.391661 m.391661 type:complete len:86 (+) comp21074_c0_seq36:1311-1568(+)